MKFTQLLLLSLSLLSFEVRSQSCSTTIAPERELVITDLSVVNDGRAVNGLWSFAHMMRTLNNNSRADTSDFTLQWLREWSSTQHVNGFAVPPRATINNLIASWPKTESGKLDMTRAPFRLLAIVNRIDLNNGPSGEGRFVYGVLDGTGRPTQVTVIFEFILPNLPGGADLSVMSWAKAWHALGAIPFGEKFNLTLEQITTNFVKPGAIGQVRTNEIALASPWQMREFSMGLKGALESTTTKQTPDEVFLNDPDLVTWIVANADYLNSGNHVVPPKTLGGHGHAPIVWARELVNHPDSRIKEARKNFATQTCTGCHSSETNTSFLHINPREAQREAGLSQFLIQDTQGRIQHMRMLLCLSPGRAIEMRRQRRHTRVH